MADKVNIGAALDDDARRAALAKAMAARQARAALKKQIKSGEISASEVIAMADTDENVARMSVRDLLRSIPGVGKAKADDIMAKCGIADSRRLRGLGIRQREALLEFVG